MIAVFYLVTVAVCLAVLAVALRPRRVPAPPTPPAVDPTVAVAVPAAEVRQILAAAARLAAQLDTAA